MRLDKYLKVSRLINVSMDSSRSQVHIKTTINGKVAKASSDVKAGDELSIRFGQKVVTATVDAVRDSAKKEEAALMFTITKEERLEKVDPEFIDDED